MIIIDNHHDERHAQGLSISLCVCTMPPSPPIPRPPAVSFQWIYCAGPTIINDYDDNDDSLLINDNDKYDKNDNHHANGDDVQSSKWCNSTPLRNLLSWCPPSRVLWLKPSVMSIVPIKYCLQYVISQIHVHFGGVQDLLPEQNIWIFICNPSENFYKSWILVECSYGWSQPLRLQTPDHKRSTCNHSIFVFLY